MRRIHRSNRGGLSVRSLRLRQRFGIAAWLENTFGWFAASVQYLVINIMGRAIWADRVTVSAHIDENMRMVERRLCAGAHEFLDADLGGDVEAICGYCSTRFVYDPGLGAHCLPAECELTEAA